MIRVIVILIGVALIWVWLGSPFTRKVKVWVSILALLAAISLVAYEVHGHKPRAGLIQPDQLAICGLDVAHSYRSDFRIKLCLSNKASATAKRVAYQVIAKACESSNACVEIGRAMRDRLVDIDANTNIEIEDTLRFENVAPTENAISWSAEVVSVQAIP